MNYEAVSDKTTIVNPTQHSYFNLSGDLKNDILDHELVINVDSFLPVNFKLIPTGEFKDVKETLFDFRNPKLIQKDRG
jgi:aldose 1-epimerase